MALATLTIDINARMATLEQDMGRAVHQAGKLAASFGAITGLSFAGVGASISAMVRSTAEAQDNLGKMSQKAGMTVESFSALGYAAKLAGADTETMVKASKALSTNIVEAARAADQGTTVFGGLGIKIKDSAGNLRATDQILLDVAGKFAGMEDGANKSALAVKLFGKSGLDLVPFLNQGKEGITALTKEAERLGVVVSGEAFAASEKFNDNLERLSTSAEGLKRSIGNAALPMLNELVQQFTDASTSGDGLGATIRSTFSKTNIEEWAQKAAYALAFVIDSGRGVAAVFEGIAKTIAAAAAQAVALGKGDFAGVAAIGDAWTADMAKVFDYSQMRDKVDAWFDEYQRTVRINGQKFVLNNAEDAKSVQATYDKLYADMGKKAKGFVEFDEATLKRQEALRKQYGDEEKKRLLGDIEFAKQKIREKYEAEINALRGADGEARLVAEIRKKMDAEVDAITSESFAKRSAAEIGLLNIVQQTAGQRVEVERVAAQEVKAVWNEANAVKAGQTGGVIANQGTPGEFVSSWDKNGNYVGSLGSPQGSPGALGNSYTSGGRRLSTREEINMLNGYAHYATGGSFMVGGAGGTDSQLVAFKASPDERVTIETPSQQRAGRGDINININGSQLSPSQIISAIKQALRVDPGLLTPGPRPG